jgi:hypothetical protein
MLVIITAMHLDVFSQEPLPREYYLEKSKDQKISAWLLAGLGLGLNVAGVSVIINSTENNTGGTGIVIVENIAKAFTGYFAGCFIVLAGIVVDVISVRHFVMSAKNKKTASLMLSTSDVPRIENHDVSYSKLPSVKLSIRF